MILPGNPSNTLPTIVYEEMEGTILMKGRSISVEVDAYFNDFLPYLEDNLDKNPMNMKVDVDFEFFNTKTAKLLMIFFTTIKKNVINKGYDAEITWFYEPDDENIKQAGEDYEELMKMKFNIIEKKPE